MTTVAALARDGFVVMAADSMACVYDRPVLGFRKIRRLKVGDGELLLGCSGQAGMPAIVEAHLKVDAEPTDGQDPQPWADTIAHAITELAADHRQLEDGRMDAHLLLGWGGQVWTIGNGVAVHHPDGLAAIGSGEGPAIGAMDALLAACPDMPPPEVVTRAVRIAVGRDQYSAGSIQVELLPAREE